MQRLFIAVDNPLCTAWLRKCLVEYLFLNRIFEMIQLEFLTTNPEDRSMAQRYWALNDNGKFANTVASLLPWHSARTANQLSAALQAVAVARAINRKCSQCGDFDVITARSHFIPGAALTQRPCSACKAAAELARREARVAEENEIQRKLEALSERQLAKRTEFNKLADDCALLFLALDRAITPRLASTTFTVGDCRFMAPHGVREYITKLVTKGAVIFRPDLSPADAFDVSDDEIFYYANKVVYQMTQPSSGQSCADSLDGLQKREFLPSPALAELWLDHASSECLRYVHDQADMHNLPVDYELELQISSAIRVALKLYSVAEVWSVIWKVVRDAASLSRRDYYNPAKAATTLPGKLKRYFEKAKKGEVVLKPWTRPDHQPTGTLGDLFSEIFGIDQDTSGQVAMDVLLPSTSVESDRSSFMNPLDRPHADRLFLAASGHGATLEVLAAFSEASVKGFSVSEAISHVYEACPYLNDPY